MADRITYVGLDVHKESIVVAVAVDGLRGSAGDGRGALAVGCQNNDPRAPNVLLRAVAMANNRVQPNPFLRSNGDRNPLAHHPHSHQTEPSETPIRTLLSGAIGELIVRYLSLFPSQWSN